MHQSNSTQDTAGCPVAPSVTLDAAGCPVAPGAHDLSDPLLYAEGDYRAAWDELRDLDHLTWHQVDDNRGFWSVLKYHDALDVLRDPRRFTSERGTLLNLLGAEDPAGGRQIAATDPPRHTAMRARLQKALAIKSIERQSDMLRGLVLEAIAPLADGGTFDFSEAMLALPVAIGGETMGLPRADWPRLGRLLISSIAPDDPEYAQPGGTQATLEAAHRELFAYFQDIYRERRKKLGDDLISVLITTEFDGRTMSPGEIMSNCYSVLLGAVVTTPHSPNYVMAEHAGDGLLDRWASDLSVTPTAVEEALRLASPVSHFMRYAVRDTRVHDTQIKAGDAVVVWLGAANRDEAVFPDSLTFDLRRKPNKHVAFGAGPHYCVGHTVARVTLRILFTELLTRFSGFTHTGPAVRLRSNFVSGYTHMPIAAASRLSRNRPPTGAPAMTGHVAGRNKWLRRTPSPTANGRVFCIPYSGCGASMYRLWPQEHDGVEFLPVELPGHETRFAEPNFATYQELAKLMAAGLEPFLDVPYGFFGHCGSALAAYEVSAELSRGGYPVPANVFVSSEVAPQDGPYGRFLTMSSAELGVELETLIRDLGGTPSPDLISLYLEVLVADVETNKRYVMPDPFRLPCPVTAIGWTEDTEIPFSMMTGWSDCGDAAFELLEGRHHRFIEAPPELLSVLSSGVRRG